MYRFAQALCLFAKEFLLFLGLVAFSSMAQADVFVEPSVPLINQTIDVPAGNYTYYPFQFPAGASLSAKFTVSGGLDNAVRILLLDQPNFQRYTARQPYSYFRGTSGVIQGVASYTFRIPVAGNYYVVVDNSGALLLPRKVNLYLYAISPTDTPTAKQFRKALEQFYQQVKTTYNTKDFHIEVKHCGFANAFSNPNITLCMELIEDLSSKNLNGAIAFVLSHELSHSLLRLWDYPLYDNEDVADELATTMILMDSLAAPNILMQAAQSWATRGNVQQEALSKIWTNDRHTISPQRARNIINWLNNSSDLLMRWQKILVPKMQTSELVALDKRLDPWVDHQLIRAELARRDDLPTQGDLTDAR